MKPLNAFQQVRAPHIVTDESFSNLKEDLVAQSLPRKATPILNLHDAETGSTSKTWQDKATGKFIYEVTFPDQSKQRVEADTFEGLDAAIEKYNARFAVSEPVRETEREKVVGEWINNFRFGKEYAAICSLLPDKRAHEFNQEVQEWGRKKYGNLYATSAQRLEDAYINALDSGALDIFEQEADLHRQLAEQENQSAPVQRAAETSTEDVKAAQDWRTAEDKSARIMASTRKGLKQIRRLAIPSLSGKKIETTPLSGSRLRPDQIQ